MDYPSTNRDRIQGCDFPKLPKQLDEIPSAKEFPLFRHRWNSNEEVAAILTAFDKHKEWMSLEVKIRPPSGSMILYSRKKVRYKKDGYCWKKRKGGKNIREDHMKLKVQGLECIYGSYVHSDILPTFHRRCYWLLQNPDIVLIHYLNVPYPDDGKVKIPMMPCSAEKKEWTKEELVEQLRPMFSAGSSDQMLEETVETLVKHLIQYHESQDKVKVPNIGYKKISCHSNSNFTNTPGDSSMVGSEDSQCKDLLMNTVCQLNAKTQHSFPSSSQRRHPGVVHIQTKSNNVIPCSENLTQPPFLLSVSQLHTSQYLLLRDGAQDSVTVTTSGCQLHPIPHVLDQPINHLSQPLQQEEVTLGFREDNSLSESHHVPQTVPGQLNIFAHPNSNDTLPKSNVMYTNSNDFLSSSCHPGNGNAGRVPHLENVSVDDIHNIINTPYSVDTSENYSGLPQAVTCNSNIPGENYNSGQHVISGNMNKSSEAFNNFQHTGVFNSNAEESCNNFQEAAGFSTSTSENGGNNFQQGMSGNANTSGNFSNFTEEMSGNTTASLSLETTDYSILDNLDFEISDIEKLCDDLNGNSESSKDHDMNKDKSCDTELANEISLFNCDLVQSCQGQPDQGFSNISSVCDSKENKSCENLKEQKIADYSPEWAYTQGGEKILVVGPWCSLSSQYGCLFDSKPVPTTLVQPGVLRCYSPAHSEGTFSLQVSCDGLVISNSVPFKFASSNKEQNDWFSITDDELKILLLDRLYVIQEKMKKSTSRLSLQKLREEGQSDQFEKKIVLFVKSLVSRPWGNMSDFPKAGKYRMTLLHLAAALGWQALVHSLIVWRTDNPSWVLDCEVDSHAVDDMSCTPMVWACAKGHRSIVEFLFHWNPDSVDILTRDGLSPSNIAQKYGHTSIISELSSLSKEGRKDLISLSREIDSSGKYVSPDGSMEQSSVFKTPNSVLGSLHIDIPGQFDQPVRTSVSSKSHIKHSHHHSGNSRRRLAKHFSIDCTPEDFTYIPPHQYDRPVRETNSEPRLCSVSNALTSAKNPMLCNPGRDLTSPDILVNQEEARMKAAMMDHSQTPSVHVTGTSCVEMDTDADDNMSDDFSSSAGSPYIDVERVSSDEEDHVTRIRTDRLSINGDSSEEAKRQMVNLAQQIIAAMPMRIKLSPSRVDDAAEFASRERSSSYSSIPSQPSPHASSYEEDSGISTPMGDGFAFDEYRYSDLGTPASSLNSPESTCPYSPYDFKLDSPPPTTEEFTEYFNAPATFMEKDFSLLTLSDQEQRKLYEAAKIIQKTYRKFRNKQQMTQQQKEMEAAVLIQKYYRRYKQYAYYKKMTQAAVLIQSQFRSYYAQKRFKKSRDAAVVIQNQYRTYKEHERLKKGGNKSVIIQQRYRSHYQRIPKHVVPNSDGQIVQIVPEGADSTQADQNSTTDNTQQADGSEIAPSSGDEKLKGDNLV